VLLRSGGETGSGELFLQELASNAIDVIATKTNFFMICVFDFVYTKVSGNHRAAKGSSTEKGQVVIRNCNR
jgi:hypothetical protein